MFQRDPQLCPLPEVTPAQIGRHFAVLHKIGSLGPRLEDGFLRPAWSPQASEAHRYIEQQGVKLGLTARRDGVGNLYLRTPGAQAEVIQIGSHLDTVPNGGNFDGTAGVVTGLEAIRAILDSRAALRCALELVVWRGEESACFGAVYCGSRAAFGLNDPTVLSRRFPDNSDGQTLADAIASQGYDPSFIAEGRPTLTDDQINAIAGHLELHIEQARVLESAKEDIGIVTSIRGPVRFNLEIKTVDPRVVARLLLTLNDRAERAVSDGQDLVLTVGKVNCDLLAENSKLHGCALTAVAGHAELYLETALGQQRIDQIVGRAAERFGVVINQNIEGGGLRFIAEGSFDHSGATPMGRENRRDANLAIAHIIEEVGKADDRANFVFNYPDAPDSQKLTIDLRANELGARDGLEAQMMRDIKQIAQVFKVDEVKIECKARSKPVDSMSPKVRQLLVDGAVHYGYRHRQMASGAGHDVAVLTDVVKPNGGRIPTGLIFVPCRDGLSHNPLEYTTDEAMAKGANLLAYAALRMANS